MAKKSTKSKVKKASKQAVNSVNQLAKKPAATPSQKRTTKTTKPGKSPMPSLKFHSPVPRSPSNPFRAGSSYSICYDLLASNPEGMTRQDLVAAVSKATGKDEKHAGYDVGVVLSAHENGERHQSCRPGFWIEREGDHVRLRTA